MQSSAGKEKSSALQRSRSKRINKTKSKLQMPSKKLEYGEDEK